MALERCRPRPGRFRVPATQDDTLKVKAVTARLSVLLGRAHNSVPVRWEIPLDGGRQETLQVEAAFLHNLMNVGIE